MGWDPESKKGGSEQLCVKRPRLQGRSKGERAFFRNKEEQRFGVSDFFRIKKSQTKKVCDDVERVARIELASLGRKHSILPLNYTRIILLILFCLTCSVPLGPRHITKAKPLQLSFCIGSGCEIRTYDLPGMNRAL